MVRVRTTEGVERGEIRREPIVHCAPLGGSRRIIVMVYGSAGLECVGEGLLNEDGMVGKRVFPRLRASNVAAAVGVVAAG